MRSVLGKGTGPRRVFSADLSGDREAVRGQGEGGEWKERSDWNRGARARPARKGGDAWAVAAEDQPCTSFGHPCRNRSLGPSDRTAERPRPCLAD